MATARQRFIELVQEQDEENSGPYDYPVAQMALLAVQIVQGDTVAGAAVTSAALAQLDELANQAREFGCDQHIERLVSHVADELGFAGNADNYYLASNSDLAQVLTKRSGIPISLAVVYIELGRALGFDLRGISFPGHFLVGYYSADVRTAETALIDPFAGQITDRDTCLANLARAQGLAGAAAHWPKAQQDTWFAPASSQQIGLRLLENLKQIHLQSKALARALAVLDLQLLLAPQRSELLEQQRVLTAGLFGDERPGGASAPPVH